MTSGRPPRQALSPSAPGVTLAPAAIGELQRLLGPVAYGWAFLPGQPDQRAIVELLADGCPVGTAVADIFDADLARRNIGDACHAFAFPLPELLRIENCRLTARIANLNVMLEGSLLMPATGETAQPRKLVWQVSNHGDLRVVGWVWDPKNPAVAQTVSFYEGSRCIGRCRADLPSAELIDKGFGDGRFAFSHTLPASLQNGREHEIRVLVAGKTLAKLQIASVKPGIDAIIGQLLQLPAVAADPELRAGVQALKHEREISRNYLPKSFDFANYPQWYAAYAAEHRPPAESAAPPHYLIIIDGVADPEPTFASLRQQTGAKWQAICRKGDRAGRESKNIFRIAPTEWQSSLRARLRRHAGLVAWIEAGDSLSPGALAHMAAAFARLPDIQCAYSDSDGPFGAAGATRPWCKPSWDPHFNFATGCATHFFVCRAPLLAQHIADIRHGRDLPWVALAALVNRPQAIHHVAEILYDHAAVPPPPDPESPAVRRALESHLPGARLKRHTPEYNRLVPAAPKRWPSVSLIIPTRDRLDLLRPCIDSLLATDYPRLEIIVADNDSTDPATVRYLRTLNRRPNCKVVHTPGTFNFAGINNQASAAATGNIIGLINNDIEAYDPAWLKHMVAHLQMPEIGAVGAKLLWPNGMVQHGGVVTGLNGVAGHIGNNWFADDTGYFGLNQVTHRVAAVTAACLLLRKSHYQEVGGMDADLFRINFNDVDLCLKLRDKGLEILWTPDARLIHHESASRGNDSRSPQNTARGNRESRALREKWGRKLLLDPYYNPNLNLDRQPYTGLAVPPRPAD